MKTLVSTITLLFQIHLLFAQSLSFPDEGKAQGDNFVARRPSLSLNGFAIETNVGVYSIKSFIENEIFSQSIGSKTRILKLAELSRKERNDLYNVADTAKNRLALENVRILESKAFLAVLTLVLEKNFALLSASQKMSLREFKIDQFEQGLKDDHLYLRTSLKEFFFSRALQAVDTMRYCVSTIPAAQGSTCIDPNDDPNGQYEIFNPYWFVQKHPKDNVFKMSTSLEILARAWDLYLALDKNIHKSSMETIT